MTSVPNSILQAFSLLIQNDYIGPRLPINCPISGLYPACTVT